MNLKGKRVLIAGMGKSGIAAMETALAEGAKVLLYDKKEESEINHQIRNIAQQNAINCFWNRIPEKEEKLDYLIISPGIPLDEEIVKYGESVGAEVMGELELAYQLSEGTWLAITGTNGKTTTTSLVGEILQAAKKETFVVGNIGEPAVKAVRSATENSWFAAEVSSFQLETIREFRPKVGAILNLTPDHLNRHKTMEGYGAAKARIFENQGPEDYFVVNRECQLSFSLAEQAKGRIFPFSSQRELAVGSFVKDGKMILRDEAGKEYPLISCDELGIPGVHNLENALAAAAVCYCGGISLEAIIKGLREFQGVEHRIEYVDTIRGVAYYNDSKGTNTDAAKKAIDAMKENIILIAGGYDKGEAFEDFIASFGGRVKQMLLLGQTADKIAAAAESVGYHSYSRAADLRECVLKASEIAREGDVVLLSPACASWGMFDNFEQRGRQFKALVAELRRTANG